MLSSQQTLFKTCLVKYDFLQLIVTLKAQYLWKLSYMGFDLCDY